MKKITGKKLNPFKVFIEMKRQKRKQVEFAKKFHRSQQTITFAFQGRSNVTLNRIAKELGMI